MRCRFASSDPVEQRALAAFDAVCHRFYDVIARRSTQRRLASALAQVDADFQLLSINDQGATTCVAVSSPTAKRPRLERLVQNAPSTISLTFEQAPRPFEEVCTRVRQVTGRDITSARVRAGIGRGHLVELVVFLSDANGSDRAAGHTAELAVEGCLGERTLEDWVASIDVAPLPRGGPLQLLEPAGDVVKSFPLRELAAAVERAVLGVQAGLPERPLYAEPARADWVLLEAEPIHYDACAQADLLLASTCLPEMLKCYLQGSPFSSLRFSKCGERFAYLKYRAHGDLQTRVQARQLLEDSLDSALRLSRLGCVVGNGVGHAHCYIDLALIEVDSAVAIVREVAHAAGLPRASWILFCDTEWQLEWVGVWEDTPAPALASNLGSVGHSSAVP